MNIRTLALIVSLASLVVLAPPVLAPAHAQAAGPTPPAAAPSAGGGPITPLALVVVASIVAAGLAMGLGTIGPGLGEGRAVAAAMDALARQPDASGTITRTLFVGLAMIESIAIYALVIALILLFANPLLGLFPGG